MPDDVAILDSFRVVGGDRGELRGGEKASHPTAVACGRGGI